MHALRQTATIIKRIVLGPWMGTPLNFFIHTAKKGNQEIYSKQSFQCKRCPKNTFVMHSKIRLPKQLESRKLLYSVFPIAQHIDRPDVPAFTATFELHFKPKWDSHPSSMLPRRIAAKAVLGKKAEGEQRNILWSKLWHFLKGSSLTTIKFKHTFEPKWCPDSPFQHQKLNPWDFVGQAHGPCIASPVWLQAS